MPFTFDLCSSIRETRTQQQHNTQHTALSFPHNDILHPAATLPLALQHQGKTKRTTEYQYQPFYLGIDDKNPTLLLQ